MQASQAYLDLLHMVGSQWINDQITQTVGAMRVIKTLKKELVPIVTDTSDKERTAELLSFKPKLGRVFRSPILSFKERYAKNPLPYDTLLKVSSMQEIFDDPECQNFIAHIEKEFKRMEAILEEYNNPENNSDFDETAEQIENIWGDIQKYWDGKLSQIDKAEIIEPDEAGVEVRKLDLGFPKNFSPEKRT